MTKAKIIEKLAIKYPYIGIEDLKLMVDDIFNEIIVAMEQNNRVEIRGFGVFTTKIRKALQGRNPRNSQIIDLPQRAVPFFKMGKELKELIN